MEILIIFLLFLVIIPFLFGILIEFLRPILKILFVIFLIYIFGSFLIPILPIVLAYFLYRAYVNRNYYTKYHNFDSSKTNNSNYKSNNYKYRTYTFNDYEEFSNIFNQKQSYYNSYEDFNRYGRENFNYNQSNYGSYYKKSNSEYLSILGLSEEASKDEIRKAYLKKVSIHHPDKHNNKSEKERKMHEEKLKKINEAYENLMKIN